MTLSSLHYQSEKVQQIPPFHSECKSRGTNARSLFFTSFRDITEHNCQPSMETTVNFGSMAFRSIKFSSVLGLQREQLDLQLRARLSRRDHVLFLRIEKSKSTGNGKSCLLVCPEPDRKAGLDSMSIVGNGSLDRSDPQSETSACKIFCCCHLVIWFMNTQRKH